MDTPRREIDRGSHSLLWEPRQFETLANDMLSELRPGERAACVSAWQMQSESGQRVTRGYLRELCAEHRADPEVVLPIFGYLRIALVDSLGVVIGPGSPIDLLEVQRPRFAVYIDPMARGAISGLFLLREGFNLPDDKIAFHGARITNTTH